MRHSMRRTAVQCHISNPEPHDWVRMLFSECRRCSSPGPLPVLGLEGRQRFEFTSYVLMVTGRDELNLAPIIFMEQERASPRRW